MGPPGTQSRPGGGGSDTQRLGGGFGVPTVRPTSDGSDVSPIGDTFDVAHVTFSIVPTIDLDGVPWAQLLEALTRRATTQRRRAFTVLDGGAS